MSDEDNRSLQAMEFQTGSVCFYATRNGATITLRVCNLSPHSERIISVPFLSEKMGGRCSMATLSEFVRFLETEVLEGLPTESVPEAETAASELRPALRAFAEIMEARLKANDHRPSWTNETDAFLLDRLREELAKLSRAVDDAALLKPGSQPRIVREAADVANFAMFLGERWRSRTRRETNPVLRQKESFAYEVPVPSEVRRRRDTFTIMAEVEDRLPPVVARLHKPGLDNRPPDPSEDGNGGEP